ncbi:hypothetical protein PoB_003816300 [Plakobranchus ocellatus]|uniref:Uncharacterized protein n=1 Tax=Plakobranchus ocellatus TaxID=259542 RepID=A0AAV4AXS3_9GAST|nr:hypothetical protein PoB_003816300 [Plakobranchus ocellatus]
MHMILPSQFSNVKSDTDKADEMFSFRCWNSHKRQRFLDPISRGGGSMASETALTYAPAFVSRVRAGDLILVPWKRQDSNGARLISKGGDRNGWAYQEKAGTEHNSLSIGMEPTGRGGNAHLKDWESGMRQLGTRWTEMTTLASGQAAQSTCISSSIIKILNVRVESGYEVQTNFCEFAS